MSLYQQAEVEAGITLLNEKKPGWQSQIDFDTLNLASSERCILGQLYGEYVEGLKSLGVPGWGSWYGFSIPSSVIMGICSLGTHHMRCDALGATWKALVRQQK